MSEGCIEPCTNSVPASSESDSLMDGSPTDVPPNIKKVSWIGLTFIAYSFTAAGPFGVEAAVKSGGPLVALLSLVVIPTLYVTPQIFIVSEMATMMPSSHGAVLWVHRAFGNAAGFFNSMTTVIYNFIDCAVYPGLFAAYITSAFYPEATYWESVGIAWICVVVGTLLSLCSARLVSHAATVMSFGVMAPFLIGFFAGAKYIDKDKLGETRAIYNNDEYEWGLLLSTLIWLFTGWRSMGTMGGEVDKPNAFLRGLPLALILGLLSYIATLVVALSVPIPKGKDPWSEGYLAIAFNEVLPNLGTGVAVAGALGNICLFSSAMLCYPRMLWGVAERGWAPKILTKRSVKTHAPYVAVFVHFIVCSLFITLDFNILVRLETVIGAGSYIMSALCLAKLRYSEPDAHRPVMYPKSFVGACILVGGPVSVFVAMLIFNMKTWWIAVTGLVIYAAVMGLYFFLKWWKGEEYVTPPPMLDESPQHRDSLATLEHATPFDGASSPTWVPSTAE